MRLEGKTAIITGGGSGLGEAMAIRFAEEGASVSIVDVDEAGGERMEVANTALFLASDEASYVTGQLICVDGGFTAV